MKGKRMLALLLAALLCPMLTACAKDVSLDGMSEEELLALKEAVEQRLPTPLPKSMDLDAMDFDELIALRDAVEERMDPSVDEVALPEGAVLLEPFFKVVESRDREEAGAHIVGRDIQPGTWKFRPSPNNYARLEIWTDSQDYIYMFDGRGHVEESLQEVTITLNEEEKLYIYHSNLIAEPVP